MRLGKDYTVEGQKCPTCGKVMDAVSGLNHDDAPKPGDWSLCYGCGELLRFTEQLGLRAPDPMERLRLELSKDWPEVERAQNAIRSLKRRSSR